jgi:hypothetical protein
MMVDTAPSSWTSCSAGGLGLADCQRGIGRWVGSKWDSKASVEWRRVEGYLLKLPSANLAAAMLITIPLDIAERSRPG